MITELFLYLAVVASGSIVLLAIAGVAELIVS